MQEREAPSLPDGAQILLPKAWGGYLLEETVLEAVSNSS